MVATLALLLAASVAVDGVYVKDEGTNKGQATIVNCVGSGVTCTATSGVWKLSVTGGGGGGSGLPADPAACAVGKLVTDQDINGVLTCAYPDWNYVANKPTIPADLSAAHYVTTQAEAGLSAETVIDWSMIPNKPSTFPATVPVSTAVALSTSGSAGQFWKNGNTWSAVDWTDLSGKPSTFPATTPVATASALSTAGAANQFWKNGNVWGQPDWSDLSGKPSTFAPVDATAAVTGGVRLTGDLGGTATSPTVPGLASRSGTGACGSNAWASTLNGAAAPTCTQPAFSNLSGLASAAQVPAATSSTNGGVVAPSCSAGNHYSSISAGTLQCSADSGGGGAPTTSKYVLQQADGSLPNAQAMGALATGIVKNTTSTGVQSIAASGTDYGPPTSGNATGLVLSTTGTGAHTAYAGTSCTNQFPRSLNASGAATCASVDLSADTAATVLPMTKGGTGSNITATVNAVHYSPTASTTATDANFRWDPTNISLLLGPNPNVLAHSPITAQGNGNFWYQINIQNTSAGASASSDYVATADNGNDSTNYVDLGINSSGYSDAAYTIGGALAGYLYTNGGDLTIGTQTAAKVVKFHTGGTLAAQLRATISDTAWTLGSGVALVRNGSLATGYLKNTTGTGVESVQAIPIPTSDGGTGTTSAGTQYGVAVYSATTTMASTAAGTAGQRLTANAGATPTFQNDWILVKVASDRSTTSTTAATTTDLTWAVASGASQAFRCTLLTISTATSLIRFAVNTPASPTTVGAVYSTAATVNTTINGGTLTGPWSTTCNNCSSLLTSGVLATIMTWDFSGVVVNGANAGNVTIYFAASTSGQTNTLKVGSFCEYRTL